VAAVVTAGQRVEVGELTRLAEPARVLDRRRDSLCEFFEPAYVVVAEPDVGIAREDAEPADLAVAADQRDAERLVHGTGRLLPRVEVRELDRARLLPLRRAGEDPDAFLLAFLAVQADRAEQTLVAVAVRIQLDDRRVDLGEPGGRLERRSDRVVEVDRGGDLAEEPAALSLFLGSA